MAETPRINGRINLDKPRYLQTTYWGRAKHFFDTTDPRTVLATNQQLDEAKRLCDEYKVGNEPPGTTDAQVWAAKKLRDSAFHPQTGEKQFLMGRMSFSVPGNMVISGCMMTFYKSTGAVIFWQWANQTFGCIVNYTNRNASAPISNSQLAAAYTAAVTASVATAVGLNRIVARNPKLRDGLVGRLVPFMAVAAANCVNLPLMRQRELIEGIAVHTEEGAAMGDSQQAAKQAVSLVVLSRILMAVPGMTIPPIAMNHLSRKPWMKRRPYMAAPITVGLAGLCLVFSTPMCCALFPQESSIAFKSLEPAIQEHSRNYAKRNDIATPDQLYFNKGL